MFMSPQVAAQLNIAKKIKVGMTAAAMLSNDVALGIVPAQSFHSIMDNILSKVVKDVIKSKILIRTEPSIN